MEKNEKMDDSAPVTSSSPDDISMTSLATCGAAWCSPCEGDTANVTRRAGGPRAVAPRARAALSVSSLPRVRWRFAWRVGETDGERLETRRDMAVEGKASKALRPQSNQRNDGVMLRLRRHVSAINLRAAKINHGQIRRTRASATAADQSHAWVANDQSHSQVAQVDAPCF